MKRQFPIALVFIFGIFMIFQNFVPHENSQWIYEFLLDWIVIIGIFALALGIWSLFIVSLDKVSDNKPGWGYSYVTLAGLFGMIIFGFTARTPEAVEGGSWGFFIPFVVCVLAAIFSLQLAMLKRVSPGMRQLGGIGLLVFLVLAVVIGIYDNTWRIQFYFPEGEQAIGLQSTMFRAFFDHVITPCLSTMFALLAFFISSAAYRAFRARNLLASLLLASALIVMLRFFPYFGDFIGTRVNDTSNWLMNVPNLAAQRAMAIGIGLGIVATAMKVILGIERGYMGRG